MFTQLIVIVIILAAFALVYFGVNRMGVPEPIKTVVLVILGLFMLYLIYSFVVSGGHLPALR